MTYAKVLGAGRHNDLVSDTALDNSARGRKTAAERQPQRRDIDHIDACHHMRHRRARLGNPLSRQTQRGPAETARLKAPIEPQIVEAHAARFCPARKCVGFAQDKEPHDVIAVDQGERMLAAWHGGHPVKDLVDASPREPGLVGFDLNGRHEIALIQTNRTQDQTQLTYSVTEMGQCRVYRSGNSSRNLGIDNYQAGAKA